MPTSQTRIVRYRIGEAASGAMGAIFHNPPTQAESDSGQDRIAIQRAYVSFRRLRTCRRVSYVREVPCMDGARGAREKNLTFPRIVRVQPCIRPLNAAVVAAGPDVIR